MTMPPSQAARALPRLKAPMLAAEAKVGAAEAWSSTHFCSGGTVAKPSAPIRERVIAASTLLWAVAVNSSRAAVRAARVVKSIGIRARSANLPPSRLPRNIPMPNRTSSQVTAPSVYPATSVIIGVM